MLVPFFALTFYPEKYGSMGMLRKAMFFPGVDYTIKDIPCATVGWAWWNLFSYLLTENSHLFALSTLR